MAAKHKVQDLLAVVGKFVADQKGAWEHDDWEALLVQVSAIGVDLSDENKRNLGNLLEASKYFHGALPAKAPKKRAAAKPRAKAKAKGKA